MQHTKKKSYCKVCSTGVEPPHDHIRPLHAPVGAEAEAHPAGSVDHQLERDVPLEVVEAPLQAHQILLVQVLHEGQARVRRPPGRPGAEAEQHGEERQRQVHGAVVCEVWDGLRPEPTRQDQVLSPAPPSLCDPSFKRTCGAK